MSLRCAVNHRYLFLFLFEFNHDDTSYILKPRFDEKFLNLVEISIWGKSGNKLESRKKFLNI